MSRVFADTSYLLALHNPADEAHEAAMAASEQFDRQIVTTDFVLLELGNACSRSELKPLFLRTSDSFRRDPRVEVVPASAELLADGIEYYRRFEDKDWSLVDCTSFVTMKRLKLRDALTTDRHFTQAGFRALLHKRAR